MQLDMMTAAPHPHDSVDRGAPQQDAAAPRGRRQRAVGSFLRAVIFAVLPASFLLGGVNPAHAQILPDSPRLLGVLPEEGVGLFYLRPSSLPGDDQAALVTWRPSALPEAVRIRLGGGIGAGETEAGLAGIDVKIPIAAAGRAQVAWTSGLAASYGEWGVISLPVGLIAGAVWSEGSVTLAPWLGVGVGFDVQFGEEAPDDEFEVRPAADLGLDVAFDAARRVLLRGAVSLGDRSAVAVGLVLR